MSTTNWTDAKARRADSDERRHGYEHAGCAIRLASGKPLCDREYQTADASDVCKP